MNHLSVINDSAQIQVVCLQSIISDLSWDISDLSAYLRSLRLTHSKDLEELGQGLVRVSQEHDELQVALT